MRRSARGLVAVWIVAAGLAGVAGCGSGDGGAPSASIPGGGEQKTAGAAEGSRAPNAAPKIEPHPLVVIETSLGSIQLKLDRQRAPQTVEHFLDHVRSGFYEGTIFHQVEPNFVVVAGGYKSDLDPKPVGPPIRNEAHNGLKNRRGTVAMVRFQQVHSATTQFLINLVDNPHLDHRSRNLPEQDDEPDEYGYCVFGEVVEGWDVIDRITKVRLERRGSFEQLPSDPILILSTRQVR